MVVIRLKEVTEEKHSIGVSRYYFAALPEIQKPLNILYQILPSAMALSKIGVH